MIYLYGLMDPNAAPPDEVLAPLKGVTGPVQSCDVGAGRLIFGDHDGVEITAKRRVLLAHTRVLEAASAWATVLPMRFGLVAEDIDEVAQMVATQAAAVATQFARMKGQVEYGVRVAFSEAAALTETLSQRPDLAAERDRLARSTDYYKKAEFGRKLGEALERRRTDAQHALVSKLKGKVTDLVIRAPESEYQVLNAHVLLPAADETTLPDLLTGLSGTLDFARGGEPAISLVGPSPLYNFVALNLAPTPQEAA